MEFTPNIRPRMERILPFLTSIARMEHESPIMNQLVKELQAHKCRNIGDLTSQVALRRDINPKIPLPRILALIDSTGYFGKATQSAILSFLFKTLYANAEHVEDSAEFDVFERRMIAIDPAALPLRFDDVLMYVLTTEAILRFIQEDIGVEYQSATNILLKSKRLGEVMFPDQDDIESEEWGSSSEAEESESESESGWEREDDQVSSPVAQSSPTPLHPPDQSATTNQHKTRPSTSKHQLQQHAPSEHRTFESQQQLQDYATSLEQQQQQNGHRTIRTGRNRLGAFYLYCKRHGKYRNTHKLTEETRVRKKKSMKCECPFSVYFTFKNGRWQAMVQNATHNHEPTLK
jgi:hypothetical protein